MDREHAVRRKPQDWALVGLSALALSCAAPDTTHLAVDSAHTGTPLALELLIPEGGAEADTPVVWVIDGYYHFDALARHVGREQRRGALPPLVMVGVGYEDLPPDSVANLQAIAERRFLDLSFPEVTMDGEAQGGGGERFHLALVEELIPAVEEHLGTAGGMRVLMGHSLGGLFVLTERLRFAPDDSAFDAIVAASPSIWWAEGAALADERRYAEEHTDLPLHLVLGTGSLEPPSMTGPVEIMAEQLAARDYPSLVMTRQSPNTGHMQTAEVVFEAALSEVMP